MIVLAPERAATLRDWLVPERPGPIVGAHVLGTGNGACLVDRWPSPRVAAWRTAENVELVGDPAALTPEDAASISGFVAAPEAFGPVLRDAHPTLAVWDRVIQELPDPALAPPAPGAVGPDTVVRRLGPADAYRVWGLGADVAWISKTWGGPPGLAASGLAWGALVDGRLVAVACAFYVGERYEDIGVVTEAAFRGRGLSAACAGALRDDILRRGKRPSWSTSPDNEASLRVAEKLGFGRPRRDVLYAIGIAVPPPARRPAG